MITLLLIKKILSLYLILACGFLIVRSSIVKASDSVVLSKVCLFVITPCVIISSFTVEHSPAVMKGLLLSFLAAILVTMVAFAVAALLGRPFHLDLIEKCAFIYPNVGNLIIPIVDSVLGPEYVIYCTGYIVVQMVFTWTHLKISLSGEKKPDWKKLFLNVNILSIFAGFILFFLRVRLPAVLDDAVSSLSATIGPVSMLITGLVIGGMDLKKAFFNRRVWFVSAGRLLFVPLAALLVLKFSPLSAMAENGVSILMITLLAASAPTASNLTLMSQIYNRDVEYVSALNVSTTLLCAVTMPFLVFLYQL